MSRAAADTRAPILVRNVVLFDGATVVPDGALFATNGRVVAMGSTDSVEREIAHGGTTETVATYDGGGRLLVPGMINGHTHLYSALAAGLVPAGPMDTFPHILENLWWRLDAVHDRESVYWSTLYGIASAIACGVTTVVDHHASVGFVRGSLETQAEAFSTAGVRGLLCFETTERAAPPAPACGLESQIEENIAFARAHASDQMIRGLFGMHANLTLSDEALERIATVKPRDLPVHIHVGESIDDVQHCGAIGYRGPLTRLDHFDLIDGDSFIVHALHLSESDAAVLDAHNPLLITNPQSNANNGVGTFEPTRFRRYLLGTDGMTGDMIATLRYHYLDLQRRRLPADDLATVFSTIPGDALTRYFPGAGKLAPGGPADFAVLEYVPLTAVTGDNVISHLIHGARSGRSWLVACDGRPLYHAGRFLSLDYDQLIARAGEAATALHRRFYG